MRRMLAILAGVVVAAAAPAWAQAPAQPPAQSPNQITCAQLPKAAAFVNTKLKPGPNTDAAKRHLAAAQRATSEAQCVAELRQVDYYAKRSLAADRRTAPKAKPGPQSSRSPARAASGITCAQLPKAAEFVDTKLKPGPNTDAAERHLAAAQSAKSEAQCVAELRKVDYYAKRSLAADRRTAAQSPAAQSTPTRQARCADVLHPTRPGGWDYHGPPVPGCLPVRL